MSQSDKKYGERSIKVGSAFRILGVGVRTSNETEAGPQRKIPLLWERYFRSGTPRSSSDKDSSIYALYTDYESDASGAYTLIIGQQMEEGEATSSSEALLEAVVPASKYLVFRSRRGPIMEIVPQLWYEIWSYFEHAEETRTFTGDYECYDMQTFDPEHTVVDVYIAIQ
ncbi:GyrI-like domain-containing protein [Paenibacillus sp. JCM 10914]|uniref:GyrI-like domain-containing protein n=1 Tax=Paenibacillus sp. JCM 10914 TaxID=1236974 RepID=UPI0003CC4AD5|nr:effector binding domain-containing protein [Paenibacillus sp. JCM 10914]GAE09240.1 transcriptional regulator, AraC family [Paenibacillus sp. JCM 10914]